MSRERRARRETFPFEVTLHSDLSHFACVFSASLLRARASKSYCRAVKSFQLSRAGNARHRLRLEFKWSRRFLTIQISALIVRKRRAERRRRRRGKGGGRGKRRRIMDKAVNYPINPVYIARLKKQSFDQDDLGRRNVREVDETRIFPLDAFEMIAGGAHVRETTFSRLLWARRRRRDAPRRDRGRKRREGRLIQTRRFLPTEISVDGGQVNCTTNREIRRARCPWARSPRRPRGFASLLQVVATAAAAVAAAAAEAASAAGGRPV